MLIPYNLLDSSRNAKRSQEQHQREVADVSSDGFTTRLKESIGRYYSVFINNDFEQSFFIDEQSMKWPTYWEGQNFRTERRDRHNFVGIFCLEKMNNQLIIITCLSKLAL